MNRNQKKELVSALNQTFEEASLIVVVHYTGMTVKEMSALRTQMREADASFKVTKNRLTRLALAGTKYESLADLFLGPTAIAYSHDPVAAARIIVKYAKGNDKLTILGGALGGNVFDIQGIKALAELPSLNQLRSTIVGIIQTPATRIAGVLQAPAAQLARVFSAYADKGEQTGEAA